MVEKKYLILICLILFISLFGGTIFAQPFDVEPIIKTKADYQQGFILFMFELDENYHITDLKNGFFQIKLKENDLLEIKDVVFPEGVIFGDEKVYKGQFAVKVFVRSLAEVRQPAKVEFDVSFQICQETPTEICFAPNNKMVNVELSALFRSVDTKSGTEKQTVDQQTGQKTSFLKKILRLINRELARRSVLLFILIFLGGFLMSLSPCVYPVIPIIMGYVGTRSGKSKLRGFFLSLVFVVGLALVYSILGVIAALTGSLIGISFQNPLVVVAISAIFILMGLSLAGFFEIPVPSSISSKVQKGHRSEFLGALIIGGVAGIIAAPCVGPVLFAILSYISETRDALFGFLLTFTFAMGLGIIFLLVGTFSGVISSLPKGGKWMESIKYFFAVLLIIGGIVILTLITATWFDLLLWGVFLISLSIMLGVFKPLTEDDKWQKLKKIGLVLIFLLGGILFVKAINTKYFPVKVGAIGSIQEELSWLPTMEEGIDLAKREQKLLLVDFYADWCTPCKKMDKNTFSAPQVRSVLKGFVLVKLDYTKESKEEAAIKKQFKVPGPPTVLILQPENSIVLAKIIGYVDKEEFLTTLNALPGLKK